jgi:hypothetical protein
MEAASSGLQGSRCDVGLVSRDRPRLLPTEQLCCVCSVKCVSVPPVSCIISFNSSPVVWSRPQSVVVAVCHMAADHCRRCGRFDVATCSQCVCVCTTATL